MGDKGGKKDKKKHQQQLATKQTNKDLKKLERAPSKRSSASRVNAAADIQVRP
jgi:hypothetical protein